MASKALKTLGLSLDTIREKLEETANPPGSPVSESPPFTSRAKKLLELSLREALQLGDDYIGTEHLLLGTVREGEGVGARVLADMGVELTLVRERVLDVRASAPARSLTLPAVSGNLVEQASIPFVAASLLSWDEAYEILTAGCVLADARTRRSESDGVLYETCTYRPSPTGEISVSVAGARVTQEAFDEYTSHLPDAEEIEGLGDAATYDEAIGTLRVLSGTAVIVVRVRGHLEPKKPRWRLLNGRWRTWLVKVHRPDQRSHVRRPVAHPPRIQSTSP